MVKCNTESALKTAIDLAKINIESTTTWVHPEQAIEFIEKVYDFLVGETAEPE